MVDALHISSQLAYLKVRGIYRHFQQASRRYNIPIALLLAIASRESGMGLALDADWTGDSGNGIGIMQIDRRYHPEFTGQTANNDHQANITYGAEFLSRLIRQFPGDRPAAIAAYNAGAGKVRSALAAGRHPDAVTTGRDYSADVLRRQQIIESIRGSQSAAASALPLAPLLLGGVALYFLITSKP
jgi:soluble lytic murein transglycosylase-like protein